MGIREPHVVGTTGVIPSTRAKVPTQATEGASAGLGHCYPEGMRFTKGHGEARGHLDCDGQVHKEGPAKAGWSGIRSPGTQVHGVSGSPAQTPTPLGSPASAPVIHFPCASEESVKITNQILSLPCSEHFRGSLAHSDKCKLLSMDCAALRNRPLSPLCSHVLSLSPSAPATRQAPFQPVDLYTGCSLCLDALPPVST